MANEKYRRFIFFCRKIEMGNMVELLNSLPEPPSIKHGTTLADGKNIPVVIVRLTDEMIQEAIIRSEYIHELAKIRKLKEYIKSRPEWRQAGFKGQLAVYYYFYEDFTDAFKSASFGEGDSGDIELGNFKADVKTRSTIYYGETNYALVDKNQFKRNPYPLYIFCSQAEQDKIVIWGYAWYQEILQWKESEKFKGSLEKDITELHRIDELKEIFKIPIKRKRKEIEIKKKLREISENSD